ncbi:uncharacterized protein LOC107406307 isoform X2 [Ziziphus jujuba]|uniref:Uncharacterized protein LOC107406307 isoform X2 n=1 Tax=Ziziphus jujuba TaxID=326968 RepID=A0ABM3IRA9_ZIZJJ|nr:uncharacterized protein LOC107406307 isoform X2 [Ziziphus jujuba]
MALLELHQQNPHSSSSSSPPSSRRTRKRKRKHHPKRLLLHQRVEVRSEEDGFLGSWHSGTVILCDKQGHRHVKYDHLLADDESDNLVVVVSVSPILNGIDSGCRKGSEYRGNIRPLPPPVECTKWCLQYGLCVDVYYKEAWWEGVIFDHNDGSEERKVFFPDLGDELKIGIDTLRITQDWNEVTENWQQRGTWIFLELIEQYRQEKYLAVSAEQMWYDVREKDGFKSLREWTSTIRDLWEELVLEVIDDNLKIAVKELVLKVSECFLLENHLALQLTQTAANVNMDPEEELVESYSNNPIDNLLNGYGVIDHEAIEKNVLDFSAGVIAVPLKSCDLPSDPSSLEMGMYKLISGMECDGRTTNYMTDATTSDQDKGMCVQPQALSASPSKLDGISSAVSFPHGEGLSNNNAKDPKFSTRKSRLNWVPVSSKVEFCPNVVDQYYSLYSRRVSLKLQRSIQTDVWKHLLYIGWKIEYVKDKNHNKLRYRYTSPDGKCYDSLFQVCKRLKSTRDLVSSIPQGDEKSSHASSDEKLSSPQLEGPQGSQDPDSCSQNVVSPYSRMVVKPKCCPQAVFDYYLHELEKSCKKDVKNMKLKAMRHLCSLGWLFWSSNMGQKNELCCESPTGVMYGSLEAACKDYMDGYFNSKSAGSICRPIKSINFSGSHLTSNEPSSAANRVNFQENLGLPIALSKKISGESSCVVNLFKHMDLREVKRLGKIRWKRNDDLLDDEPLILQMQTNLFAINGLKDDGKNGLKGDGKLGHQKDQIAPLPNLKRRKTRGALSKLGDGIDDNQPTHVLSSKCMQQVVLPTSSCHNPQTILSWLLYKKVVSPRKKVSYHIRKDSNPMAQGRITAEGVKCNCCKKVFTLSSFEVHAGSTCKRPASNIYLEDGRSLLDCLIQMIGNCKQSFKTEPHNGLKGNWLQGESDYICSICHYGGELILCDQCPSSYHKNCLGLKEIPDGDWFCRSCCCGACGQSKLQDDSEQALDGSFLTCGQYHIRCMGNRQVAKIESYPTGNWFCRKKCKKIFLGLQNLLGKPMPVVTENLTWSLLKPVKAHNCETIAPDIDALTENLNKLIVALGVLHECFEPVKEPHTRRDLVEDVVFSRESYLNRLNFKGFYTVILEKKGELITVGTVRVHGKVAEIPLIGTRFQYRRLGMCCILMNELEKKLAELGVKRLVLPATPTMLNTWTSSFGFSRMTASERLQFLDYTFLDFPDSIMCQKLLVKNP